MRVESQRTMCSGQMLLGGSEGKLRGMLEERVSSRAGRREGRAEPGGGGERSGGGEGLRSRSGRRAVGQ